MFNYCKDLCVFCLQRNVPTLISKKSPPSLFLSICLNKSNQVLTNFVCKILHYLTICLAFQEHVCAGFLLVRKLLLWRLRTAEVRQG